ncbi:MAG: hypothetical protein ACP5NI_01495 [Acetobacteraceae bacterium]
MPVGEALKPGQIWLVSFQGRRFRPKTINVLGNEVEVMLIDLPAGLPDLQRTIAVRRARLVRPESGGDGA